jgi:hypothetical protein
MDMEYLSKFWAPHPPELEKKGKNRGKRPLYFSSGLRPAKKSLIVAEIGAE